MSNEWFERGVHDAQRDELNTTYYQHYYYYRLGYDQARRQLRQPPISSPSRRGLRLPLLALLLLALAAGWWILRPPAAQQAASVPTVVPTVRPTPRPTAEPTSAPSPLPTVLALRPEAFALITNTGGDPLNARVEPSAASPVAARIPEGSRVRIVEGPVDADGFTWWRIESEAGSGWSVQSQPGGPAWLEPVP